MARGCEKETEYWMSGIDTRKLAIQFCKHIWIVLVGIVAGIVAGIIAYFAYHALADKVVYQAYSQYYLDFAADESGEVYQYYNGYTWNDLMTTDLIAANTLAELSGTDITINTLENDTRAEVLSDIRVLKVTITDNSKEICEQIQKATEKSLVMLGATQKEFNDISVIKSVAPERIYADNRLLQAIELGGIIGLLLSLIFMGFMYILDDRIMVPSDLSNCLLPVLGVNLKNSDEKLAITLNRFCEINKGIVGSDEGNCSLVNIQALIDDTENTLDKIAEASVILEIPYGKVHVSALNMCLNTLKIKGVDIKGCVISEGSNSFYRSYLIFNSGLKA